MSEGEEATCFYVLRSGTVSLSRQVHGDQVEVTRTEQRGVYAGAMQAYLTWEIELANQIKRDDTVAFGVGEAAASH